MRAEVRHFLAHELHVPAGAPLWVAVSGGVDSMVLLHELRALGHPCSVAHVDHGLRGAESDGDRAFVESHCRALGIPCRVQRVDPAAYARLHGVSTQMAARTLRQAWFHELCEEQRMPLALGHHRDDVIETFLLHLLRGIGADGWSSIPARSGPFIRPLLRIHRQAILEHARKERVPFREDGSNTDPHYLRNRVRHELLPLMEALRAGSRETLGRATDLLAEMQQAAAAYVEGTLAGLRSGNGPVRRLPFSILEECRAPRILLQRAMAPATMHPHELEQVLRAVRDRSTGARFLASGLQIVVDRDELVLAPVPGEAPTFTVTDVPCEWTSGPWHWHFSAGTRPTEHTDPNVVYLDRNKLKFPLGLRPWRAGDRMRPAGLGGSKAVSDLLIDAKVPLPEKALTYVLVSGEEIVWLAGHRLAEGVGAERGAADALRVERAVVV